jgi:hypothetical protein
MDAYKKARFRVAAQAAAQAVTLAAMAAGILFSFVFFS